MDVGRSKHRYNYVSLLNVFSAKYAIAYYNVVEFYLNKVKEAYIMRCWIANMVSFTLQQLCLS